MAPTVSRLLNRLRGKSFDERRASINRRLQRHSVELYHLLRPSRWGRSLLYRANLLRNLGGRYKGLHLGCGFAYINGFCNIDASRIVPCDITARIDKLNLAAGTVDVIYASHVFEHVPWRRGPDILAEWFRVLKPGGRLLVLVPDIERLFRIYLDNLPEYQSEPGRFHADRAHNIVYGGQSNRFDYHYQGWSMTSLSTVLREIGFNNIRQAEREEFSAVCPHRDAGFAEINGVRISLNVEAIK